MFRKKRRVLRYRQNNINKTYKPSRIFRSKSQLLWQKFRKPLIASLITGITAISAYLFFMSGYFNIREIKAYSENPINENMKPIIIKELSGYKMENLLFLEESEITNKILKKHKNIEKIEINKNYPSTIEIKYSEFPLAANIVHETPSIKKTYVINSQGYSIKEDVQSPGLPYIKIISDEVFNKENPIINKKTLDYILDSISYFQEKFGQRVIHANYKKTARELHLLTEREFYIWLDLQLSYEEQLKKLKKSLIKLDIYKENLEYIDLRIAGNNGDKIIYKKK